MYCPPFCRTTADELFWIRKSNTGTEESEYQSMLDYEAKKMIQRKVDDEIRGSICQKYASLMSIEHGNFTCDWTGFWINPLYPHLGVSPAHVIAMEMGYWKSSAHIQLEALQYLAKKAALF